jgi:uncharacterized protein YabE (DUF348 family)
VIVLAFGVVFSVSSAALAANANEKGKTGDHLVTIFDGGTEITVLTNASTVQGALDQAEIRVESVDKVEPALDSELVAGSYSVNIYRARPVVVIDGAQQIRVMTAAQSGVEIARAADIAVYPEDQTVLNRTKDVLASGGAGLTMTINRATEVNLILYGEKIVARTQSRTVLELLREKQIKLGADDTVNVNLETLITRGMTIEIWRDGKQIVTNEEEIPFETEQIKDADREIGYREVKTLGENGRKTVTYEVEMKNGVEIARHEIQSVITNPPKKQVEIVGAKNKYSSSLNEWLSALRMCETHGNYTTNTGNGYYGAYQFMPSTWNRIAQRIGRSDLVGVLPSNALPADQDIMVVANTKASSGGLATQHPGCYRKLGLSQFPPE